MMTGRGAEMDDRTARLGCHVAIAAEA
jgi:hypothetical protein